MYKIKNIYPTNLYDRNLTKEQIKQIEEKIFQLAYKLEGQKIQTKEELLTKIKEIIGSNPKILEQNYTFFNGIRVLLGNKPLETKLIITTAQKTMMVMKIGM